MKIILDAFGGDNAPLEIVKGGWRAAKENSEIELILCGDEKKINDVLKKENLEKLSNVSIHHASEVILGTDDPVSAIRQKKDSSMVVGLNLLKSGQGDAFVSAGNSGALLSGATLIVKRLKGIKRAAMAPVLPTATGPAILIDGGANVVCKSEYYEQFGLMGSIYMEKVMGIEDPKVGLLNIGTEECKGTETVMEAYQLLKKAPLHFYGNLEVRDVLKGDCQVLVGDGWTGNIVLKLVEGVAKEFSGELKAMFKKNILTMLAAFMVGKQLKAFKKRFDYKEYGGAPIMGLNAPVIKAHGSSDAKAIYYAIQQAYNCVRQDVVGSIASALPDEKIEKQEKK
jgi:fatty acid/phospholipid synthesis protein plsX